MTASRAIAWTVLVASSLSPVARADDKPRPTASEPPPSFDATIDAFRAGWTRQNGHMRKLDDAGWKVRMRALRDIVRIGSPCIPKLIALLDAEDGELRVFAAQALAFVGDPRAVDALTKTLNTDGEAAARLYAADALGKFGGLLEEPRGFGLTKKERNGDVRAHVRFALERKGKRMPPAVRKAFRDLDPAAIGSAKLGGAAPDFTLRDASGKAHRLSTLRGKKNVVLVFIYGDT